MDKQPVGQLPDLTQSNNDNEIMVITNDEYNQLKKEKISDFITDLQSTNTNNSLTTGSDGKLFVSKTINASDVDGVLSLDNIPQLSTNKLPETGISADNYSYPSSITVNDRGQVVSIVEGSAAEAGAYLDQSQITNCILSAPNGVATFSGSTFTVKQGLKVLIPNGRNEDKTLKNIEYRVPEDKTINYTGVGNNTYDFTLLYGNTGIWELSQNYQEADTPPTFYGYAQYYLNTKENIMYFNNNSERWEPLTVAVLGKGKLENGVVTSFTPYQPVALAKDYDVVHNTGDESIKGIKNFEDAIQGDNGVALRGEGTDNLDTRVSIRDKNYSAKDGTPPSNIRMTSFRTYNADNTIRGDFRITVETSGDVVARVIARRYSADGSTQKNAEMSVRVDSAGNMFALAPTYTANYADNSSKIVTTAYMANHWVTAKPTTTSSASKARPAVVVQNYLNGTSWYRVWSDGFIEQGARVTLGDTGYMNFTKSFATTNYVIVSAGISNNATANIGIVKYEKNRVQYDNGWGGEYNYYACGY